MTFTSGIPAAGQSLGSSRTQVLNNFTNYNNTISQDHVAPNSSGQGKHNKSTYPDQSSDPTTAANECAVYGKADGGGKSQIFARTENNGPPIQMTLLNLGISNNQNGFSWLPGGILIQWGRAKFTGLGTAYPLLFATSNINFPNACFNILAIGIGFNNGFAVDSISKTGATIDRFQCTSAGIGADQEFYWVAIGN